jgi:prepilin signal peptidase PulO-like enzyme (type II secretory pathway)
MSIAGAALWSQSRPDAWSLVTGLVVGFIFLLIGVVDFEHRLILHIVSVPSAVVVGVLRSVDPGQGPLKTLTGGAAGFAILLVMYLLGLVFSRAVAARRGRPIDEVAFGFGDVMLGGVLGLALGWPGIVVGVFLGILAAGVFSLGLLLARVARGRYSPFLAIPYGPFLLLGGAFVFYGGRQPLQALLG